MNKCKFLKEHIKLIKLLNSSKNKKFIKEANEQTKEVLKYLKNLKV
jgi:hypothetical protein